MRKNLTKEQIEKAISESKSMAEAARVLNINYKTLRFNAKKFGLFEPNQAGKGITKELKSIDATKRGFHVKNKLWKNGLKDKKCEICGLTDLWLDKPIVLELHHIDGNRYNNDLTNLQILCPNCHSQTHNYRRRNFRKYKDVGMS